MQKHLYRCSLEPPIQSFLRGVLAFYFLARNSLKYQSSGLVCVSFSVLRNYLIMCSQASKINQNLYKSRFLYPILFELSLQKVLILPRIGNILKCMELKKFGLSTFQDFLA